MRKLLTATLIFPVVGHAQSCPLIFDDVMNTPAPVFTPAPLFDGVGGSICVGLRRCTYNSASLSPAEISVSGHNVLIRKRVIDENLDPGFCSFSTYLKVALPALTQGDYAVRYELTAANQFGVDVDFVRTGEIMVGAAPSPIPALSWAGLSVLLLGLGYCGIRSTYRT